MLDQPGDPPPTPPPPAAAASPHRGSPAWLVALAFALVLTVGVLQRPALFGASVQGTAAMGGASPPSEALNIMGRLAVGMEHVGGPAFGEMTLQNVMAMAQSRADQLRVVLLDADLSSSEAALARLDEVEAAWARDDSAGPPSGPEDAEALHADAQSVRRLLTQRAAALSDEERQRLVERHGWFARLALTRGLSDSDAARQEVVQPTVQLAMFMGLLGLGFLLALLAGLGMLVTAAVLAATGRLRLPARRPPSDPLMLETFVVFLAGFLAIKLAASLVVSALPEGSPGGVWTVLGLQWSLALAVFWPLVRRGAGTHARMGWNRGRGVAREVLVGACGWAAAIPLLVGAAMVAMLLNAIAELGGAPGGGGDPLPQNPVMDLVRNAGVLETVMTAGLVMVWAPLVEETIFRGALLGSLRSGWGFVIAGGASALVFAVVHAYPLPLLPVIVVLGFVFAFLREWRGTLVPSATAHFIQNTMAFSVLMVLSRLAGL